MSGWRRYSVEQCSLCGQQWYLPYDDQGEWVTEWGKFKHHLLNQHPMVNWLIRVNKMLPVEIVPDDQE